MKRTQAALTFCTLVAALAGCYAAWGQSPSPQGCCPASSSIPSSMPVPAAYAPVHASLPGDPDKLVESLVAVLNETNSADTVLVTVKALTDVGPRARAAVPAIIRSAERLGLLKDILHQKKEEDGEGVIILEALEEILKGKAARPAACYRLPDPLVGAAPSLCPVVPAPPPAPPTVRESRKPRGSLLR